MAIITHYLEANKLGLLSADSRIVYRNENAFTALQNYAGVSYATIAPNRNSTSLNKNARYNDLAVAYSKVGIPFDLYYAVLKNSLLTLNTTPTDYVSQFWGMSLVEPNLLDVNRLSQAVDATSSNPGFPNLRFDTNARTVSKTGARYSDTLTSASAYTEKLQLHSDLVGKVVSLDVYDNTLTLTGNIANATIAADGSVTLTGNLPALIFGNKYFFRFSGSAVIFSKATYPLLHVDITMSILFAKDYYSFIAA